MRFNAGSNLVNPTKIVVVDEHGVTNYAFSKVSLDLVAGSTLQAGTIIISGSSCYGDTDLWLKAGSAAGSLVAGNDQYCSNPEDDSTCINCSYFTYDVPSSGMYTLLAGCYQNDKCSGTVAYRILPPPPPPSPPAPNAPRMAGVAATIPTWVSWQTGGPKVGSDARYFTSAAGANTTIFPVEPGATSTGFVNTALPSAAASGIVLTNGAHQASSVVVSNNGQPFQTGTLCPSSPGAFTFKYSFSLTAAPTDNNWNGISDGLTLAFIDASFVTPGGIQWKADVSNVLVPVSARRRRLTYCTY